MDEGRKLKNIIHNGDTKKLDKIVTNRSVLQDEKNFGDGWW